MKEVLLTAFYLLPVMLYGQGFAVSADKMNVAYEGVDNPLKIVVEQCSCDKLVVTTDNGKLTPTPEPCGYILSLAKPGTANFSIQKKEGKGLKNVGVVKYSVKDFPPPIARIAGVQGGRISIQVFKVTQGITAEIDGFDYDARFPVKSFKIVVERGNEVIFTAANTGGLFGEQVRSFLAKVKVGDRVLISEIYCVYPWGRAAKLEPVEVILK